ILNPAAPTGKASRAKVGEASLSNGLPCLGQQPAIERYIVQRQKRRPQHLVGQEKMMEVGPAEMAAWITRAIGLQRRRNSLVDRIADTERSGGGERRGIAAVARRQHTVEHVNSAADGMQDVLGAANAHEIARLFGRQ